MIKTLRSFLSLALALVLALGLCACGDDKKAENNDGETNETVKVNKDKDAWYLGGNNVMVTEVDPKTLFEDFEDTIDPASIYSGLEYTEEMLYGGYTLNNKETDIPKMAKELPFKDVTFDNGTFKISELPVALYMGKDYFCNSQIHFANSEFSDVTDIEIATIEFLAEDGTLGNVLCSYEVKGNKITFKCIEKTSEEGKPLTYKFSGLEFEYTFELCGPYLTIKSENASVKLIAYGFSDNVDELYMSGYSLPSSPLVGDLDCFVSSDAFNYAIRRDGSYYDLSAFKLSADGKFTLFMQEKDLVTGEKMTLIEQYAYIVRSDASDFLTDFSIMLFDGEKIYDYTDDISAREARSLKDQGVDMSDLTDEEIEEIANKKSDLFDDLKRAFEEEGIKANINKSTGEIALDASVLFSGDSAVISADGKSLLNKFVKAYTSIVYNDTYKGFISKTMVEGHTAPLAGSTYESGLALSEERANKVKEYCLSAEAGADSSKLSNKLEAIGLSNSKPVYGSDGEIDKDACRRVSFKMIVDISSVKD